MVEQQLVARLRGRDCPHIAALIQSPDDLPALLASFFSLGAARNGWLAHGSLPGMGDEDRRKLEAAGLGALRLEESGRLSIVELDLTLAPETWVDGWSETLDGRLDAGFDAVWFARFPIRPNDDEIAAVLPFEQAWMDRFRDRPMVTLCPYIVGSITTHGVTAYEPVAAVHDAMIDVRSDGPRGPSAP